MKNPYTYGRNVRNFMDREEREIYKKFLPENIQNIYIFHHYFMEDIPTINIFRDFRLWDTTIKDYAKLVKEVAGKAWIVEDPLTQLDLPPANQTIIIPDFLTPNSKGRDVILSCLQEAKNYNNIYHLVSVDKRHVDPSILELVEKEFYLEV